MQYKKTADKLKILTYDVYNERLDHFKTTAVTFCI